MYHKTDGNCMLIGLHTCGDLSPLSIQTFINSNVKVLVNVSCCYNKLSEKLNRAKSNCKESPHPLPNQPGFPMSKFIKDSKFALGFSARTLACQATCRWDTQSDAIEMFQHHFYRSILQRYIRNCNVDSHINVGGLPGSAFKSGFKHYATIALTKLKLAHLITDDLDLIFQEFKDRELELAFACTLRALVAPAIESLILVDRLIYLNEMGFESELFPLFAQLDSPRNMALVAKR